MNLGQLPLYMGNRGCPGIMIMLQVEYSEPCSNRNFPIEFYSSTIIVDHVAHA